ncbi:TetR/AcrR family transcriptional regulator [Rufibacter roseus]|uniref:TetR/AcrR family transcriptional regulator n=1 Tax=Rufibacter roseus TaxID=1567108 RepID=A0ABW2DPI4_9BACT|nr:TetR/AcrR family transcriptional regulator [Rufibacter roseus]
MEKLAEKKKAILNSTLKLIKEKGFHGTPMSLVAKKAGVAAGTIYHYFDSKDALILELYTYTTNLVLEAMLRDNREDMDYKDQFFSRWISRCKFYIANPDALFFIEQFVNSPYHSQCTQEQNECFQNEVVQFIDRGIETGVLRKMDRRLMGIMIHSNILIAAKIHLAGKVTLGETEMQQLALMAWDSVRQNH